MAFERIHTQYRQLQEYVGWTDADAKRLLAWAPVIMEHIHEIVDDFYAEILRHPQTSAVLTGGQRQVNRLRQSLADWITDLVQCGRHDAAYVERRWKIGKRHMEIGLPQIYVNAAFARLRHQIKEVMVQAACERPIDLGLSLASMDRVLDLDLAVIQDAYETELLARQRPLDDVAVVQQQVIAQISEQALVDVDVRDLLDRVVVYVAECFDADYCEILEYGSDDRVLLRSAFGWDVGEPGRTTLDVRPGHALAFVRDQRLCVVTEDHTSERRYQLNDDLPSDILSSLWIRIHGESQPFGLLGVHFRHSRLFLATDADFMHSVANVLATTIKRQTADEHRRIQEDRLRRLVERLPAGAIYVTEDGQLLLNQLAESITGISRGELATIDDWNRIVARSSPRTLATDVPTLPNQDGTVSTQSALIRRPDGQERLIDLTVFRSDDDEVWLVSDVTETDRQKQRALQAERLAAIGQMIAGLAHESRNALQRIRACTEMLEFDLESNPAALEMLGRIGRAQDDLQRLFDEVRSYAAPMNIELGQHHLTNVVNEAWELLGSARAGRDAELILAMEDECPLSMDRFRMVQVFRNLFENSLAACADPARITIEMRAISRDGVAEWEISVRDNGPGLSEEARKQVFEPFFTTKTRGTGLGMAIAGRIIDAHGGRITLGSRSAAEFLIHWPRVEL